MTDHTINDIDPTETREWLDALNAVVANDGTDRAAFLLQTLLNNANNTGIKLSCAVNTPYRNTIKTYEEKQMPPDEGMAQRISALIRWNAVAMVLRAGKYAPELGGILLLMHQPPRCTKRVLTIFLKGQMAHLAVIYSIFKAIVHLVFMRAHFWKGASANSSWINSGKKWKWMGCRRIHIPG